MQHQIALITGATSGIGAAFAKEFAKQNYNLIITGRRSDKINALAHELRSKYGVAVEVVIAELADARDLESIVERIKKIKNLGVLVNNAGFGNREIFHVEDIKIWEKMLKVHTHAVVQLTHAALPNMIANKNGVIINVSSILAFFPYRKHSVYAATKAFINLFTETISYELKNTGVKVQALCPGVTATDFHEKMGKDPKKEYRSRGVIRPLKAHEVVEKSLKHLAKNKVICIPGFFNKVIVVFATVLRTVHNPFFNSSF